MKSMFGMCMNWKVLAGVGLVVVAVLVFKPAAAVAIIPLAVLAVCPLSMILMMFAMKKGMDMRGHPKEPETREAAEQRLQTLKQEQRDLEQQLSGSREAVASEEKAHLAS